MNRTSPITATCLALALGLGVAGTAEATPLVLPPNNTDTPIYIQYNNAEQFSATNSITNSQFTNATGTWSEGNWGVIQVSSIQEGTALNPQGSDIQGGGTTLFSNGQNGGNQILGIFYGINVTSATATGATATGGYLDLYWFDSNTQNVGTLLNSATSLDRRTGQSTFNGYTNCTGVGGCSGATLLLHAEFVPGAGGAADTVSTVVTPANPATGDGTAQSYQSVLSGLWAGALDSNFFTLDPNNQTFASEGLAAPDLRTDSNYSHNGAGAWNVANTDIVGLRSNDPSRGYAVPEPGSLALVGLGLLGMGLGLRRKKGKAA